MTNDPILLRSVHQDAVLQVLTLLRKHLPSDRGLSVHTMRKHGFSKDLILQLVAHSHDLEIVEGVIKRSPAKNTFMNNQTEKEATAILPVS